jgi:hypothetical protein
MEPLGLNFFTPNEKEWMKQNWLPCFCATDRKRLMGSKGGNVCKSEGGRSQMQVLIEEMREAFAKEFPYHLPKVKGQRLRPHQLKHLRLTEEAWGAIGQVRLYFSNQGDSNPPCITKEIQKLATEAQATGVEEQA